VLLLQHAASDGSAPGVLLAETLPPGATDLAVQINGGRTSMWVTWGATVVHSSADIVDAGDTSAEAHMRQ
jgi:hypothetical protein